jgi:hypothetical protein
MFAYNRIRLTLGFYLHSLTLVSALTAALLFEEVRPPLPGEWVVFECPVCDDESTVSQAFDDPWPPYCMKKHPRRR